MRLNILNSLFGLCLATVAVSCSNDQVIDDLRPAGGNDSDMISFIVADNNTRGGSFGNRPGLSTRGSVTTTDNMYKSAFAVYGDMVKLGSSNPNVIFNGTEVEDKDNDQKWTYSNLQYWFSDRSYSFTAIHPHPADKSAIQHLNYTDNSLSFTYSPSSYTDGIDIMTATHRRNSSFATTPVYFEFHHIFSRINFKATVDPTSTKKYVIKKLALVNVSTGATYTITPAPTGYQSNDFTENWTNLTEANGVLFDITSSITVDNSKPYEFFPVDNALMVIPQDVPNDVELQIVYYAEGSANTNPALMSTKFKNVTVSAHNGVWEKGKSYTYSFTLGDNESIIFNTPVVQDWSEAEGGNYVITD